MAKTIRILLLSGLALSTFDCTGQWNVKTTVDEYGYTVTHLADNEIGIEGERGYSDYAIECVGIDLAGVERAVFLDPVKRARAGETPVYFLRLKYSGQEELHFERRKSLEMKIDNYGPYILKGFGAVSRSHDEINKTYVESFDYVVPMDVLLLIANATEVTLIITGRDLVLDGYLLERNFVNYRRFVDEYVDEVQ
jgi:hypothetical protein